MENFYELLRLKQSHNTEIFPLMPNEKLKYKRILDDEGLIGAVSNITDLTTRMSMN
jgi:hypothetical protein